LVRGETTKRGYMKLEKKSNLIRRNVSIETRITTDPVLSESPYEVPPLEKAGFTNNRERQLIGE